MQRFVLRVAAFVVAAVVAVAIVVVAAAMSWVLALPISEILIGVYG